MLISHFRRHLSLHEQGESCSEVTSDVLGRTWDSIARGVGLIVVDLTKSDCIATLTVAKESSYHTATRSVNEKELCASHNLM
jgi:hypothetical protein